MQVATIGGAGNGCSEPVEGLKRRRAGVQVATSGGATHKTAAGEHVVRRRACELVRRRRAGGDKRHTEEDQQRSGRGWGFELARRTKGGEVATGEVTSEEGEGNAALRV